MHTRNQRLSFLLSFISILTVAAVFLFIATGMIPYWQELSGTEIQDWFAGPFTRFAYMMILVHILSIGATIWAFIVHRRSEKGMLWLVALVTLLICQGFNFTLFGANYNLALQSGTLEPEVALQTIDNWDIFHKVRTASVCISAIVMSVIFMRSTKQDTGSSTTAD